MNNNNDMETITNGNYVFRVVDYFPDNYTIWNIGDTMRDGYLPLCQLLSDGVRINDRTLLAIKMHDAQNILEKASRCFKDYELEKLCQKVRLRINKHYSQTLEGVLKKHFSCNKPFDRNGNLTKRGCVAYNRLISIIEDLSIITDINDIDVIETLDEIVEENY